MKMPKYETSIRRSSMIERQEYIDTIEMFKGTGDVCR